MSVSPVIINDIIPRTQIIATASQTVFDTDWTADATTDIVVYRRASDEDADDQTQEVSDSLYNVTFIGDAADVRVTFLSGVDEDDIITIVRDTPADRTNLYTNTNFTPSMLNEDFGILTLIDQQAQMYDQQSAPHYNLSCSFTDPNDLAIDMILPILPANYIWKKSSDNTRIEAVPIPSGTGSGTVTTGLENQLAWYAADGDTVSGLPTANSAVLRTNGSGVPAWQTTLPSSFITGTTTNDSASAGYVGEYISIAVPQASTVPLTTTVVADMTSISLTAGDWDVWGNIYYLPSDTTTTLVQGWISTVSATLPDLSGVAGMGMASGTIDTAGFAFCVPSFRVSLASTTTVYISAKATFGGTASVCGALYARRRR